MSRPILVPAALIGALWSRVMPLIQPSGRLLRRHGRRHTASTLHATINGEDDLITNEP